MSKFLLIKIIGGFIAIAIVAGGISIWIKTHHSSVMVQAAQKILPARVNPLLNRSNEVYWFVYDLYFNSHIDDGLNTDYSECYYKGGYIPNGDMKKQLIRDCKNIATILMQYAHKTGYFKTATLDDWLDQSLIKKIFEQHEYFSKHFDDDGETPIPYKYREPSKIKNESVRVQIAINNKLKASEKKDINKLKALHERQVNEMGGV